MAFTVFTIVFLQVAADESTSDCACADGEVCVVSWDGFPSPPWCYVKTPSHCDERPKEWRDKVWSYRPCSPESQQAPQETATTVAPATNAHTTTTSLSGIQERFDTPECKCLEDECYDSWDGRPHAPWCYVEASSRCDDPPERYFGKLWSYRPCSRAQQPASPGSYSCTCKKNATCSTTFKGRTLEPWCAVENESECRDGTWNLGPGKSSFDACNGHKATQKAPLECECQKGSMCNPIWKGFPTRHWCYVDRRSPCEDKQMWWTHENVPVPQWWSQKACGRNRGSWIGPTIITSCVLLAIVVFTAIALVLCPQMCTCRPNQRAERPPGQVPDPKVDTLVANICEAYGLECRNRPRQLTKFNSVEEHKHDLEMAPDAPWNNARNVHMEPKVI